MDGWYNFATIAFTGVVGVITLMINKRYDAKITSLQNQNLLQAGQISGLQAQNKGQGQEIAELKVNVSNCKEEHTATKDELRGAREALAEKTKAENLRLQTQIDALKAVTGSKDSG